MFGCWRLLTIPVIAGLGIASYLGMWSIAYDRLTRPDYVARMALAAHGVAYFSDDRGYFDPLKLVGNLEADMQVLTAHAPWFWNQPAKRSNFLEAATALADVDLSSPDYVVRLLAVSNAGGAFVLDGSTSRMIR